MCVYCHLLKKIGSVGRNFFFFFGSNLGCLMFVYYCMFAVLNNLSTTLDVDILCKSRTKISYALEKDYIFVKLQNFLIKSVRVGMKK